MLSSDPNPGKSKLGNPNYSATFTLVSRSHRCQCAAVNFPSKRNGSSLLTAVSGFQYFIAVFLQLLKSSFVCKGISFWEASWGPSQCDPPSGSTATPSPAPSAPWTFWALAQAINGGTSLMTVLAPQSGLSSLSDPFSACCSPEVAQV